MDLFSDRYITRDEGDTVHNQTVEKSTQEVNVTRRVYLQDTLNTEAEYHEYNKPWTRKVRKLLRTCGYDTDCCTNAVPIVKWLPRYDIKRYLIGDLVAGATVAVMHIPQGMAYAMLAEVSPTVGLYMAFFPVLIYVMLGTSPHVSMGTFAVACLMAGKVVTEYAYTPGTNSSKTINATSLTLEPLPPVVSHGTTIQHTPIEVISALCLTVGLLQVLMWVFRLGALSTLLSEPLVSGFTCAASFHVITSQLKDLLGLKIPKLTSNFKVIYTLIEIFKKIKSVNAAACIMSLITCVVIAVNNEVFKAKVAKRSRIPIPIELIAIVTGTLASRYLGLRENYGISLVGPIPTGLPMPQVPKVDLIPVLALDALTITIVTYTITMSMALIFASREKYEIEPNQELLAMGASNVFGSFFLCAPFCASLSRSYIQYQTGAKTFITSVVSACLVLCVLLWIGPFFEKLPRSVLASIIVVSLKGLSMQVLDLCRFCKLCKLDAIVWAITFLTTLLVNVDYGLVTGVVASVAMLFSRAQRPYTCLLGRVPHTDLYLDIKRYAAAKEVYGVKIFHYCGGLNFATKNLFRSTLYKKVGYLKPEEPTACSDSNELTRSPSYVWDPTMSHRVHCVIIDATALSYVDAPGVKTLINIQDELVSNNVRVLLAGASVPVQEMIARYNRLEPDTLQLDTFPTVHDAVVYHKITSQTPKSDLNVVPNSNS